MVCLKELLKWPRPFSLCSKKEFHLFSSWVPQLHCWTDGLRVSSPTGKMLVFCVSSLERHLPRRRDSRSCVYDMCFESIAAKLMAAHRVPASSLTTKQSATSAQPPLLNHTCFCVPNARPRRACLDRSRDGARWMGDTLVRALATVRERQSGDGGGLRGVCRALFQHCVVAIGYIGPSEAAEGGGLAVSGAAWEAFPGRGPVFRKAILSFCS